MYKRILVALLLLVTFSVSANEHDKGEPNNLPDNCNYDNRKVECLLDDAEVIDNPDKDPEDNPEFVKPIIVDETEKTEPENKPKPVFVKPIIIDDKPEIGDKTEYDDGKTGNINLEGDKSGGRIYSVDSSNGYTEVESVTNVETESVIVDHQDTPEVIQTVVIHEDPEVFIYEDAPQVAEEIVISDSGLIDTYYDQETTYTEINESNYKEMNGNDPLQQWEDRQEEY